MRGLLKLGSIVVLAFGLCLAEGADASSLQLFGPFTWGMDRDKVAGMVEVVECKPGMGKRSICSIDQTLVGLKWHAEFCFTDDKLHQVILIRKFDEEGYKNVKKSLIGSMALLGLRSGRIGDLDYINLVRKETSEKKVNAAVADYEARAITAGSFYWMFVDGPGTQEVIKQSKTYSECSSKWPPSTRVVYFIVDIDVMWLMYDLDKMN